MATTLNPLLIPGSVVQVVRSQSAASMSISTTMDSTTTPEPNTAGAELLTATIVPKSATNILLVQFFCPLTTIGNFAAANYCALFRDSTVNAIAQAAGTFYTGSIATYGAYPMFLSHSVVAGSISSTTFKLRAGPSTGTMQISNYNGGAAVFGTYYSLTVTEVSA